MICSVHGDSQKEMHNDFRERIVIPFFKLTSILRKEDFQESPKGSGSC